MHLSPLPALGARFAGETPRTLSRCEPRDERRATTSSFHDFTPTDSAEEPL